MRTNNSRNKPVDTKIQLTKSSDFFEIYLPPFGFTDPAINIVAPFTIVFNGFIAYVLASGFSQVPSSGIVHIFSLVIPWLIGIFLECICLSILFTKTFIRIDRHEISLVKTLFGRKVNNQPPTPKREIAKLIFTREDFYVDSSGERWKQPAELSFQIGIKPIVIGGHQGGGEYEYEIEWLANEVSEWLDKPLTIVEAPVHQ